MPNSFIIREKDFVGKLENGISLRMFILIQTGVKPTKNQ